MLVLSSQSRLLVSNPVVWLCHQEPVRTFQKELPPEKAKLRRWWKKDVLQLCSIDLIENPARFSSEKNRFTTRSRAREQ